MKFLIKSYQTLEFVNIVHQFADEDGFNSGMIETDPNTDRAGAAIVSIQDNVAGKLSSVQMNRLRSYLLEP